jgi:hypothetical protein
MGGSSKKGGGSSSIPTSYTHTVLVGSSGSTVSVDADLDNIRVKELPRIELGDIKVFWEKIPRIELSADTVSTVNLNLAIKEIPDVRTHLPSHYDFGVSILGVDVVSFSVCGESQLITEKYVPRLTEKCR